MWALVIIENKQLLVKSQVVDNTEIFHLWASNKNISLMNDCQPSKNNFQYAREECHLTEL